MGRLDEDVYYQHLTKLHEMFDKLVKNRAVICDNQGRVKAENIRYYRKYNLLANETALMVMIVAGEKIKNFFIPDTEMGSSCCSEIEGLMEGIKPKVVDTIKRGTYNSLTIELDRFASEARKCYMRYVAAGMHNQYWQAKRAHG